MSVAGVGHLQGKLHPANNRFGAIIEYNRVILLREKTCCSVVGCSRFTSPFSSNLRTEKGTPPCGHSY